MEFRPRQPVPQQLTAMVQQHMAQEYHEWGQHRDAISFSNTLEVDQLEVEDLEPPKKRAVVAVACTRCVKDKKKVNPNFIPGS